MPYRILENSLFPVFALLCALMGQVIGMTQQALQPPVPQSYEQHEEATEDSVTAIGPGPFGASPMNDAGPYFFGLSITLFVAGLLGGLVALLRKETFTWRKTLSALLGGGLTSGYLAPAFGSLLGLEPGSVLPTAFALGFIGHEMTLQLILANVRRQIRNALAAEEQRNEKTL